MIPQPYRNVVIPGLGLPEVEPRRIVSPLVPELKRRESKKDRVLARLQRGPATNVELVKIGGIRATGRITELRAEGYVITAAFVKAGIWRYTLSGRRVS